MKLIYVLTTGSVYHLQSMENQKINGTDYLSIKNTIVAITTVNYGFVFIMIVMCYYMYEYEDTFGMPYIFVTLSCLIVILMVCFNKYISPYEKVSKFKASIRYPYYGLIIVDYITVYMLSVMMSMRTILLGHEIAQSLIYSMCINTIICTVSKIMFFYILFKNVTPIVK